MKVEIDNNELSTPLVNDLSIGSTVRNVISEFPVLAVADIKASNTINRRKYLRYGQSISAVQ